MQYIIIRAKLYIQFIIQKIVNISVLLTLINHVHVRPLIYPIMSIQSECPALKFIVPPHPTRKKTRKTYELKKLDKILQSFRVSNIEQR